MRKNRIWSDIKLCLLALLCTIVFGWITVMILALEPGH